jgi:hypothetical protein
VDEPEGLLGYIKTKVVISRIVNSKEVRTLSPDSANILIS